MKHRVRRNRYGNLSGYEGNKRTKDFGLSVESAAVWALVHNADVDDSEGAVEIAMTEDHNIEAAEGQRAAAAEAAINPEPITGERVVFLATAMCVWARGDTPAEALKKMHSIDGKRDRYIVYVTDDTEVYLDDMGFICRRSDSKLLQEVVRHPAK